jgi:large subunit ribosomal protein L25
MNQFDLNAEARETQGKGASRRLRREGKVPGIMYGATKDPLQIQLDRFALDKHLSHEAFYSSILTMKVAGAEERVVLKDLQRHPYKAQILHIDFLRIAENQELTMRVPLHFMNEETCAGVKQGAIVQHLMTELEVICLPKDLPEYIEVDVEPLDVGDTIHIGALPIPEGVKIAALVHGGDPNQSIVSVQVPKVVAEETVEVTEEGAEPLAEGEEPGAEGEEPDADK